MGPKCEQCELSDGLCPSARKVTKTSSSKTRSKKVAATVSVEPDQGAGPKIEVELEEESVERKVDINTLAAAPERISPIPDVPVKAEDTS